MHQDDRKLLYEIALAGLLHDIGKLGQRAHDYQKDLSTESLNQVDNLCLYQKNGDYYSHQHTLYTFEFFQCVKSFPEGSELNFTTVQELAAHHHNPSTDLQKIVKEADELSAAMERIEDDYYKSGRFRQIRLKPIVNEINLDEKGKIKEFDNQIAEFTLDTSCLYPQKEFHSDYLSNFKTLWDELLANWKTNKVRTPWGYINRGLSILEAFTWCVPSAANVKPDISLYDHLKTTSAIAVCLYAADDKEYPFILLTGDFSGIQNYIYDLHHGAGGTAKTLRGRSFKVGLFSDSVAMHILKENNCPLTHNLMSAGGHFYLLLPYTSQTLSNLDDLRGKLEGWLLENFRGDIRFNLAWTKASREEIKNFTKALEKVHLELDKRKVRPFSSALILNGWTEEEFAGDKIEIDDERICKSCYKRPGISRSEADNKSICEVCWNDRSTGKNIINNKYIAFIPGESEISPFYKMEICNKPAENADLVLKTEYDKEKEAKSPVYLQRKAIYIPKIGNEPLEFKQIAVRSKGRQALAYLKADVDNLGYIFAKGLKGEEKSISRIATLSRMLDYFFSAYLREIIEKEIEFENIYIVYAGGDDLVMIGPWNNIFDFAPRMRDDFAKYTCGNKAWGLSAGIALAGASTPVSTAVQWAEDQLDLSKRRKDTPDGKIIKDGFSAFGETMSWQEAKINIAQAKKLVDWLQDGTLSSGQVRRLFTYSLMWREYDQSEPKDTRQLRYIPLLIYDLKRNWKDAPQEAIEWAVKLQNPQENEIKQLYFICQYALNGARKSGKEKEDE